MVNTRRLLRKLAWSLLSGPLRAYWFRLCLSRKLGGQAPQRGCTFERSVQYIFYTLRYGWQLAYGDLIPKITNGYTLMKLEHSNMDIYGSTCWIRKPLNTWQVTLRIRISRITFLYLEHTIATFEPKQSPKDRTPQHQRDRYTGTKELDIRPRSSRFVFGSSWNWGLCCEAWRYVSMLKNWQHFPNLLWFCRV